MNIQSTRCVESVQGMFGWLLVFGFVAQLVFCPRAAHCEPLSLQRIVTIYGGLTQWSSVVIVSNDGVKKIGSKQLRIDAPTINLAPSDIVAFDEAADKLIQWRAEQANQNLLPALLDSLPKTQVFKADGTLRYPYTPPKPAGENGQHR